MKKSGWFKESARHSLAAKGVKTNALKVKRKDSPYFILDRNAPDFKDRQLQEIGKIGKQEGLSSIQKDQLILLIQHAFPDEIDKSYITEWARRIKQGYAYNAADSKVRKIWLDIIKGDITRD